MIDDEKINNYTFDNLYNLSLNDALLAEETIVTQGLVLNVMQTLGLKPSYEFFINYTNEYTIIFFKSFYPDVKWQDVAESSNYKRLNILDDSDYLLGKRMLKNFFENNSFEHIVNNIDLLSQVFIKSFSHEKDYYIKIKNFCEVSNSFYEESQFEQFLTYEFFENIFLNSETESFIYTKSINSGLGKVFIFSLKSYLIKIATEDIHNEIIFFRRFYFSAVLSMAQRQDFCIEPKFYHKIVPTLLQNSTLAQFCENAEVFIESKSNSFLEGLTNKFPTVNLITALIIYIKRQGSKFQYSNRELAYKCLISAMKKISEEDCKKVLSFTNFTLRKNINILDEDLPLFVQKSENYDFFKNPLIFIENMNHDQIMIFNHNDIVSLCHGVPQKWDSYQILALEISFSEKRFSTYLLKYIKEAKELTEISPNLLDFIFSRNKLSDIVIKKFSFELENMLIQVINNEKQLHVNNNFKQIDLDKNSKYISEFLMHNDSNLIFKKVAEHFLKIKDYAGFFALIQLINKNSEKEDKVINIWKKHINEISITDIFINSENIHFILVMNSLTQENTMFFSKVKRGDDFNILKKITPLFSNKEKPMMWFKSIKLSWQQQKNMIPGALLYKYPKKLNKKINNKLSPEMFKDMLVSYLDGFLLSSEKEINVINENKKEFNPFFVNECLRNYNKNLPKLLRLLEDRPEYYVIVAINAFPESSVNALNRIKYLLKMNVSSIAKMEIKKLLTLNFGSEYQLKKEQFLFLKDKINWEICFKGLVKLVKNVYWTAKCREEYAHANHISSMINYTFNEFNILYSFQKGIETEDSTEYYPYLLDPAFFNILQQQPESLNDFGINEEGKNNFITSLLKHIRYEFGNNDNTIFDIFLQWIESIKNDRYSWSPLISENVQNIRFISSMLKVKNQRERNIDKFPYLKKSFKQLSSIEDIKVSLLYSQLIKYKELLKATDVPTQRMRELVGVDKYSNIYNFLMCHLNDCENIEEFKKLKEEKNIEKIKAKAL